jgi:hypothetical protein
MRLIPSSTRTPTWKLAPLLASLAAPTLTHAQGGPKKLPHQPAQSLSALSTSGKAEADTDKNKLSGYVDISFDPGTPGGGMVSSSSAVPMLISELSLSKESSFGTWSVTLRNSDPISLSSSEMQEYDCHLQWSKTLNESTTFSLGLNNYYYPKFDGESEYHELEARLDWVGEKWSSYFYIDKQLSPRGYSYLALGTAREPLEVCEHLTFTPSAECTAILAPGDVYTKSGIEKFSLTGTLTYQRDSGPALYLALSMYAGVAPEWQDFSLGTQVGMRWDF